MKLFSLALDYDGTIAWSDRIEPGVRDAIALARARGITVLLATGRILDELRRVAGELHFVDGVIAENGAVLHFPESDHTSLARAGRSAGVPRRAGAPRRGLPCRASRWLTPTPPMRPSSST